MDKNKLSYNPDFAIHPGKSLKDELDFLNLTSIELSQRTGLSEKHISQIINGADPITPDTAVKLEIAIGTPATFWSNLQKNYDLVVARIASDKKIAKEIQKAKSFNCYLELASLGFVEQTKDWHEKTKNLLKFFGVGSFDYLKNTESIAFRQSSGDFNEFSLAAWLRCGEIAAVKMQVEKFDKKMVKDLIPEMRKLTTHQDGFGLKLQELCASVGIALVYTPYFKQTKVNGSCRWIGDKAVIQLNTKGAFSDIFWFTFFHELGHILFHGVKGEFVDYNGKAKDEKEKEADKFASDTLIPINDYKNFLMIKPLSPLKIKSFAESIGVSSGIVLGRMAHDGMVNWRKIARLRERLTIN